MIPVDEKEAGKRKGRSAKGWAMPYDKLLDELRVQTEGRILRADLKISEGEEPGWSQEWDRLKEKPIVYKTTFEIDGKTENRVLFIQHTVSEEGET